MALHILKLCVGCDSVEDLLDWYRTHPTPDGHRRHVTRMWPRRETEVVGAGSLYWVIKGLVLCRQPILGLEETTKHGVPHCALVLSPEVIRTEPAPRRPFQGWRYLPPDEAPRDLAHARRGDDSLPPGMAEALAEFGVR
jgi:hypothetical protein